MLIFQFTLPREERRQVQAQPLTLQNFNPRSHERSDHITQSFVFRFFNFNPRSHERSDETYKTLYISDLISIHAPTRGATVFRRAERNSCRISIHAPTRGATIPNIDIPDVAGFQSTLPREERPQHYLIFKPYARISIHAPTRGATVLANNGLLTD